MQETPRSVPIGVVLVSSHRTTLLQQLTQHWDCRTVIYPWHHHRPPLEYGQRKIQTNNWIYFAEIIFNQNMHWLLSNIIIITSILYKTCWVLSIQAFVLLLLFIDK